MRKHPNAIWCIVVLVAVFAVAACAGENAEDDLSRQDPSEEDPDAVANSKEATDVAEGEAVRVGVFSSLDTPGGESIINAAELAIEEINADGGVHGLPIEAIVRDTEGQPEQAVEVYQRFALSDDVIAALGVWSSGEAFAIQEHMARLKLPFINTGSSTASLADPVREDYDDFKYWFRFGHNSEEMAEQVMAFLTDQLAEHHDINRIAIFTEDGIWTKEVRAIMREVIDNEGGLELVAEESFDVQTTDYNPVFQRVIAAEPDQIIDISSFVDSAGYVRQWRDLEPAPMGGINISAVAPTFYDETGGAADGLWNVHFGYPTAITEKTVPFYEAYNDRFGSAPNWTAWYAYDAMHALREALERLDEEDFDDPNAIVESLEETDYTGVMGRWVFGEDHHSLYEDHRDESLVIVQWQDGSQVAIWPSAVAEGEFITPPWWDRW